MIFSKKNAGKWVASKGEKIVGTSHELGTLVRKVGARKDKNAIRYDLIPPHSYFAGIISGNTLR
ncbi:MAG: hypothetical protein PHZ00_07585 [Candidatus Peribacteraceae bacterium]|nr:hypothetical protein [Candidatus Peribacteraceae bacterium]